MAKLSVVIVNYNVKYFLEQCLQSVFSAAEGIDTEVWVVDNNSVDGSVQMVRDNYPQVHLIVNSDNPGFATANNQALRQCSGDYILLLNPDTLVQHDTFSTCLDFYTSHPDCGGLSVRMINGEGEYLKESKRGFPSPSTSFFKISGLIRLFPHSKKVGAYYMGHLNDNEVNEVDVLPGAFLMISRQALEKTGLLDESYFMYGEDIDFSWRIRLAGFKNYYLPTTRILHYKGESTRKSSMNYVYTFYNAMAIFAGKYFSKGGAKGYILLIKLAIWLRASLDFLKRIVNRLFVPFFDFAASFAGFFVIKQLWTIYRSADINYYPDIYTWLVLPIYSIVLLTTMWIAGGYDKPVRIGRIVQGMSIGTLCLLAFYSLLNEELRFSRAIVLLGSVWSILATIGIRGIMSLFRVDGYKFRPDTGRRHLIIGRESEYHRVLDLFNTLGIESKEIRCIHPKETDNMSDAVREMEEKILGTSNFDEIVFCSKDVPINAIIDITEHLNGKGIAFRIAPEGMDVLIGSNYTGSPEDLYRPESGNIANVTNRRSKRLFDIASSLTLTLLSPILFWPQKRKRCYFTDCFSVLIGKKSWVGYSLTEAQSANLDEPLPNIRCGVFQTRDRMPRVKNPDSERLDRNYATNYHIGNDIAILFINILNI